MPATATPPRAAYPRPQVCHQHNVLFREPAYEDGQPYADLDDEDDDGDS